MRLTQTKQSFARRLKAAFTLAEVVVCILVVVIFLATVINAYIYCGRRVEWSGYSLAAQALAVQYAEQVRAANWDTQANPVADQTTNLTSLINWSFSGGVWSGYATNQLDLPVAGTNVVVVTNYVTVQTITNAVNTRVTYKMIRVDTVWPFIYVTKTNSITYFTNSILTYRAPDQ